MTLTMKRCLQVITPALLLSMLLFLATPAFAATLPDLGTAASFGALAGSRVTNTGTTNVLGDVGVSPGSEITGFPPGTLTGSIHAGDAMAQQAQNDVTSAYNDAAGQQCNTSLTGLDLGGMTLTPAVYCFTSSAQLTGQLTLDGQGNPASVFIFQIGSTLTTASNASVLLINGAQACNVFWQIGSSATLGTNTTFKGNILALTSITLNTTASSSGGLYARNGAVTLDTNSIQACATPLATATPMSTNTATPLPTNTQPPVATNTLPPGATNTLVPSVTDTPQQGATQPPPTRPLPTDTVVPPPTNTMPPQPTQPPTNTPVSGLTDTPVLQPTSQLTVVPTNTVVLIDTQVVAATSTPVANLTSTSVANLTSTPGAVATISTTPYVTPSGSAAGPGLPNTGSNLSWASPFILLLGVLLLGAGLRIGGLGKKHLR